jgi:hypothetical protein
MLVTFLRVFLANLLVVCLCVSSCPGFPRWRIGALSHFACLLLYLGLLSICRLRVYGCLCCFILLFCLCCPGVVIDAVSCLLYLGLKAVRLAHAPWF